MKTTINGKTYDTEHAERQAEFITYSNTSHELYIAEDRQFFLVLRDYILDGRRLRPTEALEEISPELCEPPVGLSALQDWLDRNPDTSETEKDRFIQWLAKHPKRPESEEAKAHRLGERNRRLTLEERILPVTNKEALTWCVKTQIPESLRGYLLDCL